MTYKQTAIIEKSILDRVNRLLDIECFETLSTKKRKVLNAKEDDFIPLVSVVFGNENIIDIDVCSGTGNYYDNCVLKDKKGKEITCFDCSYSIDKTMEFNYGEDTYIIVIKTE